MKRMITTLCVLAIALTGVAPAMAAETRSSHYYPVEVREYMEGDSPRIDKVYQLSLADDPGLIPTGDFERDGRLYYLLDMTRKDEIGVDTKLHTQTITKPSSTNDMETILKNLDATIETATEDGYTGVLQLDHTTVKVTTDGYATRTQTVSSTRTYPNLSDADVSLIPKTVEDKGKTLTLADVKWEEAWQTEAEGSVMRYSATAIYTGKSSSQYATGYTVTADYTGEVAKTGCDVVTYTAMFGSMAQASAEQDEQNNDQDVQPGQTEQQPAQSVSWQRPALIGGAVVLLLAGGLILVRKWKRRA